MKLITTLLLLMIAIVLSQPVVAGESSGWGEITELNINKHGRVRIKFSKPIVNPDNCERTEFYIVESDDSVGAKQFFSAILAAHTAGKQVSFWISGCTPGKHWGFTRPMAYDIYMKP